jgi:protocatechuate 3,4-dioxygenase beta subunit
MHNDDRQRGRILSRRDVLKYLGVSGAALLAACQLPVDDPTQISSITPTPKPTIPPIPTPTSGSGTVALPTCVVRPELTEGPYYVDADFNRSDIRSDPVTGTVKEGSLLTISFIVSQVTEIECVPLEGAKVEIWHCDAEGIYSGVSDPGFDTTAQKFLRGYQVTNAAGQASFITIYPGWYPGRTVHVHFKIHFDDPNQSTVFTSQLFFDDALSDQVFSQPPYSNRGQRSTLNASDRIYNNQLLLNVTPTNEGNAGTFDIGLQMG